MKKTIITLGLTSISLFAFCAQAEIYLSGKLGYSHEKLEDDKNLEFKKGTLGAAVAVGYDFYETTHVPIRTEFELTFSPEVKEDKKYTSQKATITTFMLNGYYDFRNESDFTPYVSFGLGVLGAKRHLSINHVGYIEESNSAFAWNAGFGVNYKVMDNLEIGAGYRYVSSNSISYSYLPDTKVKLNQLLFSVTYRF